MQKLIELKKDETILVSSQVESFLRPDFVYLPIPSNEELVVYKNAPILIGDDISLSSSNLSSVSGIVRGIKKMSAYHFSGYFLEIENDFQESRKEIKRKKKLSREEILTYIDLEHVQYLVFDAIDDEIYVLTENFYLFLYYEDFLALLDELDTLFGFLGIILCVKASSSENINKLMSALGMYPNIVLRVVPDYYLLGKPQFLLSYLGLEEKDSCVILASDFYHLFNILKRGRTKSDMLLTLSGNALLKPMVVQVKIGTKLKDVLLELGEFVTDDVVYFAGGLMSGEEIDADFLDSFVITPELTSVLFMKKEDQKEAQDCIHCGECSEVCPVGIHPLLLKEKKYYEKVKDVCLKCGLCSYICPVHIHFNYDGKESSNE